MEKNLEINEIINKCKEDVIHYILNNPMQQKEIDLKQLDTELSQKAFDELNSKIQVLVENNGGDKNKITNAFKKCTSSMEDYFIKDCDLSPSMIREIVRNLKVIFRLLEIDIKECMKEIQKEKKPSNDELILEKQKEINKDTEHQIIAAMEDIIAKNK